MPILHLQKRVVEVGRIRAGDQVPAGKGRRPRKLANWRLTSKDKARLDAAAELWGGEVQPWEEREGEWQLYTGVSVLPIVMIPGQLPTSWFEKWTGGGCERRCDGVTEMLSDGACLCGDNAGAGGKDYCSPHTRMAVMLPDIPGLGSWLLQSNGWNAATELQGTAELLQQGMLAGVMLPAQLRLEQRTEVKGGQTRKYAVPVIDIGVSLNQLTGGATGFLPGAATPAIEAAPEAERTLPPPERVSVGDGVAAVESAALPPATTRANAAEPIGRPIVPPPVEPVPVIDEDSEATDAEPPVAEAAAASTQADASEAPAPAVQGSEGAGGAQPEPAPQPAPAEPAGEYTGTRSQKLITKAQKDKLNVLYGRLREVPVDNDGHPIGNPKVTIGGLYAWAARERNVDVDVMIDSMNESITHANSQLESAEDVPETLARTEDGRLHFGPLRDRLTREEASKMIDGMEKMDKANGGAS